METKGDTLQLILWGQRIPGIKNWQDTKTNKQNQTTDPHSSYKYTQKSLKILTNWIKQDTKKMLISKPSGRLFQEGKVGLKFGNQ